MGERGRLRDYLQLARDAICEMSTVKRMLFLGSLLRLTGGAPTAGCSPHLSPRDPSCSNSHRRQIWECVNLTRKEPNSDTRPQYLEAASFPRKMEERKSISEEIL